MLIIPGESPPPFYALACKLIHDALEVLSISFSWLKRAIHHECCRPTLTMSSFSWGSAQGRQFPSESSPVFGCASIETAYQEVRLSLEVFSPGWSISVSKITPSTFVQLDASSDVIATSLSSQTFFNWRPCHVAAYSMRALTRHSSQHVHNEHVPRWLMT